MLSAARRMGSVKTSMLQDVERGNRLELASICDAVLELSDAYNISMPVTQAISSIAHFKDLSQNSKHALDVEQGGQAPVSKCRIG
ncbi:ketopantoate reductase family protein [Sphingobium ummariense]|uniref:ketopantoate reductase family protein n=1 Tax=Sphingobium ummariense TaxID=420994 RepID=UPI0022A97255|nr:ketopantoate reductase C-terminal domain-containing protein [Sphingobium ummariense]